MRVVLPFPYELVSAGDTILIATPDSVEAAVLALAEAGSLLAFAAGAPGASLLESRRGSAYSFPIGLDTTERWVVRHYRRGSVLTRWLADRYLRLGLPRPLRELAVSSAARERGVETPPITAIALYPAGRFYRADLATRYIPESCNLAQALFGSEARSGPERLLALSAAGRLVRKSHEKGLVHVDLTLQNILIEWGSTSPRAHLLDLDACHMLPGAVPPLRRKRTLRRFARSIRGWEQRSRRLLDPVEREAFEGGYQTGSG